MTIQELAAMVAREYFIEGCRDNDEIYLCLINEPEWVRDMVREAHGDMLPDDIRYAMIVEVLDAIASHDDPDTARAELEPDAYNADRLRWLSSHLERAGYCNDAFQSGLVATGENFDIIDVIGVGQVLEKCEVFDYVRQALEVQLADNDSDKQR